MAACPNINSSAWKNLVKQMGEQDAYRVFIAHDYNLPDALPIGKLNKEIGVRQSQTYFDDIPLKVKYRRYNNKNNTAHSFKKAYNKGVDAGFRIETVPNYLPYNKIKRAEREAARNSMKNGDEKFVDDYALEELGLPPYTEVDDFGTAEKGQFANITKLHGIQIRPSTLTVDSLFEYLTNPDLNSVSAEQKQAVLPLMEELYGITLEDLKALITNKKDAMAFVLLHEKSHMDNNDLGNPETQKIFKAAKSNRERLLHPEILKLEARANFDAYTALYNAKYKSNANKFINEYERALGFPKEMQRDLDFYNGDRALMEQEEGVNVSYIAFNTHKRAKPEGRKRFKPIMRVEEELIEKLYTKKIALLEDKKKETDVAKRIAITSKINKLQSRIDKKKETISELKKLKGEATALENIEYYAEEHLAEVRELVAKGKLSLDDIRYIKKIIQLYIKAGNFDNMKVHLFANPDELKAMSDPDNEQLAAIKKKFKSWQTEAEAIGAKLREIEIERLKGEVGTYFGKEEGQKLDVNDLFMDISYAASMVYGLRDIDHPLIQLLTNKYKEVNNKTQIEANKIGDHIDELLENVSKAGFQLSDVFELFRQTQQYTDIYTDITKTGYTGNMVMLYSQEYWNEISALNESIHRAGEGAKNEATKNKAKGKQVSAKIKWLKENQITFDMRLLFPDPALYPDSKASPMEIQAHKDELLKHLGDQKMFDEFMEAAEKLLKDFKLDREAQEIFLAEEYGKDSNEYQVALAVFDKSNSPYHVAQQKNDGDTLKVGNNYIHPTAKYVKTIPRRFTKDGKDTNWYDKKYEEIRQTQEISDLYDYIAKTLAHLMDITPDHVARGLQANSLPILMAGVLDNVSTTGISAGATALMDNFKRSLREDGFTQGEKFTDAVTGEENRRLTVRHMKDLKPLIAERLKIKVIQYQNANEGNSPKASLRREMRKEIENELALERSFDFGKLIKAYSYQALTYHNRSMMEDLVRLTEDIMMDLKVVAENEAAQPRFDAQGNPQPSKNKLKNFESMFNYWLEEFYGTEDVRKKELITEKEAAKKALLTSDDKKRIKELDEAIAEQDRLLEEEKIGIEKYKSNMEILHAEKESIGGDFVGSHAIDGLMKYVQLKGMGWNFFSAFANIGFGYISGFVQSGGNMYYNEKEYQRAFAITLAGVGRSASFNQIGFGQSEKVRTWMDKLNVLKESKRELFTKTDESTVLNNTKKWFKWANPYNPQQRSEYLVQSTDMVAVALHNKLTNEKGEEKPLWELMKDDGTYEQGWFKMTEDGRKIEINEYEGVFLNKVADVIIQNHGNYDTDNPMQIKQVVLGRAVAQFRTWMFSGIQSRIGDTSKLRYRDEIITRKGRYRTGIGILSWADGTGMNSLQQTIFNTRQLLKRLANMSTGGLANMELEYDTYRGASDSERFTKEDAANLRKNLNETIVLLFLFALGALLRSLAEDDEDKSKLTMFALNFLINQTSRLAIDIELYSNPMELEKLQKNLIPMTSLLNDAAKLGDAFVKQFDDRPPYMQTGPQVGMNSLLKAIVESTPLINNIFRTYKTGTQVWEK